MNLNIKCFKNLAFFLIISFLSTHAFAMNWPNWLGPNYNGSVDESLNLNDVAEEFITIWDISVGAGWSAPVVYDQKVFLHDRIDDKENLTAYNIDNGQVIWRFSYKSNYRDDFGMSNGPRSTPSVTYGLVVIHSPEGLVHAIDSQNGELRWSKNLVQQFGSPKGFFGRCSSPLILGDKVILNVGGEKVGVVAFSLANGKTIWQSKPFGNDYASVVPLRNFDNEAIVAFMREGLVVINSLDGSELYFDKFQSPINASVNAASPLVLQNGVFLSSCYEVGAGYWNFEFNKRRITFTNKWKFKEILDCHYSTPIEFKNYLYGFHGRQERGSLLRCIRISDGKIMWSASPFGTGHLIRVGGIALCLTEKGELFLFETKPSGFEVDFRQQILGPGRAYFAYSKGSIFARDKRRLIRLDLIRNSEK